MTVPIRALSVLSYAQGFTLWHYNAKDKSLAPILEASHWSNVQDLFSPGDRIMVSAKDGIADFYVGPDKTLWPVQFIFTT